jgi:hypothetical protein
MIQILILPQEIEYLHSDTLQDSKSIFLIAANWVTMLVELGLMSGIGYRYFTIVIELISGLYFFDFGFFMFVLGMIGIFKA